MSFTDTLAITFISIALLFILSLIKGLGLNNINILLKLDFSDIPWNKYWSKKFTIRLIISSILTGLAQYLLLYENLSIKLLIFTSGLTLLSIIGLIKFNKWDNYTIHVLFAKLWGLNFIFYIYLLTNSRVTYNFFIFGLIMYIIINITTKNILKIKGKLLQELAIVFWFYITSLVVVLY